MTTTTATPQRESVAAGVWARVGRWPRSPIFYGIVVAFVAVIAGQWWISPPAAYGLCSACHGRDLVDWAVNHIEGKHLFVTAAGAGWPRFPLSASSDTSR